MPAAEPDGNLRHELERRIKHGRCAYCGAPAAPDRPLTREHVIPRSRGGGKRDHRVIVPACAACNHGRGCQEVVLFFLARPSRIAAFLEYLATLPPETIGQVDSRVFAELYAAVWILGEGVAHGPAWRGYVEWMCTGRRLHRRRYAARRVVHAVGSRMQRIRTRGVEAAGPSCLVAANAFPPSGAETGEGVEELRTRLVSVLSLAWRVPAERILRELRRAVERLGSPDQDPQTALRPKVEVADLIRRPPRRRRRRVPRRVYRARRGGRG